MDRAGVLRDGAVLVEDLRIAFRSVAPRTLHRWPEGAASPVMATERIYYCPGSLTLPRLSSTIDTDAARARHGADRALIRALDLGVGGRNLRARLVRFETAHSGAPAVDSSLRSGGGADSPGSAVSTGVVPRRCESMNRRRRLRARRSRSRTASDRPCYLKVYHLSPAWFDGIARPSLPNLRGMPHLGPQPGARRAQRMLGANRRTYLRALGSFL